MTRIVCISLGSIGQRHLRNARSLLPDAQIGVYRQHTLSSDAPPTGADLVFPTLEAALAFTPDAVIISSPASAHCANALPFLERNIPVFLEKPLATSMQETGAYAAAASSTKGFLMIGYVLRFLPALHAIKAAIDGGELGKVHTAHIEVGQYLPDWRPASDYRAGVSGQARLGGGALLELSHEIDYATWLFGWPRAVHCVCGKLSDLEIDVEDCATLILDYPDKQVTVKLDFLQRIACMAVKIVAEKATLTADLIAETATVFTPEDPAGRPLAFEKRPGNDLYLRQFDFFFAKALPGYRPVYEDTAGFAHWCSSERALDVLQLVDLAREANRTGRRLPFAAMGDDR